MRQFSGAEPLVGEVVGLRTFRVDESGLLLPLYSDQAWYDGVNTAECTPPAGGTRPPHESVAPDCECGFYAYGTAESAAHNRQTRYVLAVVSCWGRVVAGTQGIRAEYARIDALWLSAAVPKWVRTRVALRYPNVQLYLDRDAMVSEHAPSVLPCYEPQERASVTGRAAIALFGGAVLVLGLLPRAWLDGPVRVAWVAALGWVALAMLAVLARHQPGRAATIGLLAVAAAWLAAPAFGLAGWVLRLPVLRAALVAGGGFLLALRPGYFPVVTAPRERAFCGVRP